MRIATETELGVHVDTNYYWWHHLRLHVPVQTTPDVVFQAGDESVHMAAGEVWVFDTWQRHRVDNPASSPRIHLVVDTVGSAPLWDLIEHPDRVPHAIDAGGSCSAPRRPPCRSSSGTGRWSCPPRRSTPPSTRCSATCAPSTLTAPSATACVLGPFRHDWHDLTARFGADPAGWPARRALLDSSRERVRRGSSTRCGWSTLWDSPMRSTSSCSHPRCRRASGARGDRTSRTRIRTRTRAAARRGRRARCCSTDPLASSTRSSWCARPLGVELPLRDPAALTEPGHHRRREPRGDRGHRRARPRATTGARTASTPPTPPTAWSRT